MAWACFKEGKGSGGKISKYKSKESDEEGDR